MFHTFREKNENVAPWLQRGGLRAERDSPSWVSQNLRRGTGAGATAEYFHFFLEGYEIFFCSHTRNRSSSVSNVDPEVLVEKKKHLLFKKNCLSWWNLSFDPAVGT